MYDVTDKKTLYQADELRKLILKQSENPRDKVVVVCANKVDLENEREVSTEEGKKFAEEFYSKEKKNYLEDDIPGATYFETSAKTGKNVMNPRD